MKITHKLLTRDEFREAVFERDGHKCVFCKNKADDAHHIIERRLWTDGGYYINNGASVCESCHLLCEQTFYSVEEVREKCGIDKKIIPDHLYEDHIYDKWGNMILDNDRRMKGELFYDESVQKVLSGVLDKFTDWVKYPRTHHLPWSQGINDDDRVISSLKEFEGKRVIITTKMDGENANLYTNQYHARSIDGKNHESRNWVKNFWSQIRFDIPSGWRICGENLFAKHSIQYNNLPSYFLGFSIWDETNNCIPWDDTKFYFEALGIVPVPVIYDGPWDETMIRSLYKDEDWENVEGYVVRVADGFSYKDFKNKVAKFVRKGHIQTTKHWMFGQRMELNYLEKK